MTKAQHLKVIEYEKSFTPFTKIPMVAMFNSTRIDEDMVRELITSGKVEHHPFVVVLFKSQYENLYDLEENI